MKSIRSDRLWKKGKKGCRWGSPGETISLMQIARSRGTIGGVMADIKRTGSVAK